MGSLTTSVSIVSGDGTGRIGTLPSRSVDVDVDIPSIDNGTQQMAIDNTPDGVGLNCDNQQGVDTPRATELLEPKRRRSDRQQQRRIDPSKQVDDIAPTLVFLVFEEPSWISGGTNHINGGWTIF